jgi:2-polyprenyl-3-methyl-5-hydroxy-6-metoxy-1,4-benzoquinol methylase
MNIRTWKCSICKSQKIGKVKKYPAKSDLFSSRQLIQCSTCGCKSIFPMISDKELAEYNKDYWGDVQSDTNTSRKLYYFLAESRANYLVNVLGNLDSINILDVGSGQGYLIDVLKEKFPSMNAFAVEIDSKMHEILNDKCEMVFSSWKEITNLKFNVIILSHILEHMTDPIEFALGLKSMLKKNGYFFIDIPNSDDLHVTQLESHLFVFNEKSLKRFIHEIDLTIVDFTILGQKLRKLKPSIFYRINKKILPKKIFQKYKVLRNKILIWFRRNKSLSDIHKLHKTGKNRAFFRVILKQ